MNRYPVWKYAILAIALVVGVIYTLPNFFGEAPAVQISPLKATVKIDAGVVNTVKRTLASAGIGAGTVLADPNSIRIPFSDSGTQLKAKEVLDRALNPNRDNPSFSIALNLMSDSPSWLTAIGALPMYLGLDLRGGIYFLLQVDTRSAIAKHLDGEVDYIGTALRKKGLHYSGIAREGDAITVKFRDAATRDQANGEIAAIAPDLRLKSADEAREFDVRGTLSAAAESNSTKSIIQQNVQILRNRINELGIAEPVIQQQGTDRIVVELPGVQDTARAKEILGRTASLEVRMVEAQAASPRGRDYNPQEIEAAIKSNAAPGTELFYERHGDVAEPLLLSKQVLITGKRLTNASASFDPQDHSPIVVVELDGEGARIVSDVTRDAIGRRMAILLAEKGKPEVITAPVIRSQLGGRFEITGLGSPREAADLALLLRAGALAAPMDIVEERTVGPTLGAQNIRIGFRSTWIGFCAITVFMIAYYGVFGIISITALAANILFLVALLSMLQATLTLPGMAGIALTVGMAIDANVLINERIREELRNGNTPQAAINAGYSRALGTIVDSNITTLIAGIMLFLLGSGPVKGFAVVLCLGIITSIFSSVMLSRGMVNLYYGRRHHLQRISIGLGREEDFAVIHNQTGPARRERKQETGVVRTKQARRM